MTSRGQADFVTRFPARFLHDYRQQHTFHHDYRQQVSNHTRLTEMQTSSSTATAPRVVATAPPSVTDTAMSSCVEGMVATAEDISMFAELRILRSSSNSVSKLNHTYRHHISRSSMGNVAAMREARCRLKHDVESNHIESPSVWVRGELCIPAGPLPSFIDAMTIEDALHDLPEGARLVCIKCVSAWRMGHLDTKSVREYLRSVAWQSPALQQCVALAPARVSRVPSGGSSSGEERSETSEEGPWELLSEEEMRSMMCGM